MLKFLKEEQKDYQDKLHAEVEASDLDNLPRIYRSQGVLFLTKTILADDLYKLLYTEEELENEE